jgi:hypothetical protein
MAKLQQATADAAARSTGNTATEVPLNGVDSMPTTVITYTKEERNLAALARKLAMNRNVLYHGTRYAQSILRTGVLFASDPVDPKVSLTRSPEVAAYFALLPRDDCEERGAILIFDRQWLRNRHRIYPIEKREFEMYHRHNEAEEELWGDLIDVGNYLVGFVSESATLHSDKIKRWNVERRMQMEARLDELLHFIPDWRFRPEEQINLNKEKLVLARNALFNGMGIAQVAKHVSLSVGAVRRLAGRLRRRVPCGNKYMDSHLNWSLAQVVSSWDLSSLLKEFERSPNKVTLPRDLVTAFGADRIKALMTYCGMSHDDALKTLSQELPRIMRLYTQRKVAG